ncbi:hypothetical protein [Ruegeria sp. HKCCD8929]|uniref:hypothetical protein n=1 Tax=Ruegeria sp. HKCCD8929 TaxID=2683006 RepID=UPI001488BDB9|nr:hypothetical protein [Ruegeria sp. HKCCD8929]
MIKTRSVRLSTAFAMMLGAVVVALLADTLVDWELRVKWYELGRLAGFTDSHQQAVRGLCEHRSPGLPPREADLRIEAKASTFYLVSEADRLTIYCDGID